MCGILVTHGLAKPFSHRALRTLQRRGPDGIGFWTDGRVGLGHCRLAVIGLDERGAEPMENDTHVLAYNGEIYNFQDLRRRLVERGRPVSGANDGEVLLHAWSEWGEKVLGELVGFWAFAVLDKRDGSLTLVRDQLGIKPMYYWAEDGAVCAASMLKTILDVVDTPPELDYRALSEYVRYQFTFGDKTFVRQIRRLLPGQIVRFDLRAGGREERIYEDIFSIPAEAEVDRGRWIESTRELLESCILESTVSDTPFTTFCSGGLDSSLITAIVRPELTYHCNFSDPDCNETVHAKRVAQELPTRLFVVNAEEDFDLVAKLADLIEDFDDPTIGSVILPLDDLLAQVKRRYKVILTGTGGDELFAGYVRYQLALGVCHQDSYLPLFQRMQALDGVRARFELAHRKGRPEIYRFYDRGAESSFADAFEAGRGDGSDLDAMLRFDRRYFLGGLLNIDDKMCGRHSMESRPSFLHQRFVRHVFAYPSEALLAGDELKAQLRGLAAPWLPRSIVTRKDKMGFTTPIGTFVNNSAHLIREQLADSPFSDHYDLDGVSLTAETKYSREVFGLLLLDLWLNRYAGAGAARPGRGPGADEP